MSRQFNFGLNVKINHIEFGDKFWMKPNENVKDFYKNYKNRPRNARVVVENNVASFFPDTVY